MRPNRRDKELVQICKYHNLTILNTPNVHTAHNQHHNRSSTTIDLAITTEIITTRDFITLSVTDAPVERKHHHSPIIVNLKTSIADHAITNQKLLSRCNWESFRDKMNQTCAKICPPPASTSLDELDSYISKFSHETAKNLWESCPNKKIHQGLH